MTIVDKAEWTWTYEQIHSKKYPHACQFMVDTDIFNVFKWQKCFQNNGENMAGQCVWEIRKVSVKLE